MAKYRILYCKNCWWVYPENAAEVVTVPRCPSCGQPLYYVSSEDEAEIDQFCTEQGIIKSW